MLLAGSAQNCTHYAFVQKFPSRLQIQANVKYNRAANIIMLPAILFYSSNLIKTFLMLMKHPNNIFVVLVDWFVVDTYSIEKLFPPPPGFRVSSINVVTLLTRNPGVHICLLRYHIGKYYVSKIIEPENFLRGIRPTQLHYLTYKNADQQTLVAHVKTMTLANAEETRQCFQQYRKISMKGFSFQHFQFFINHKMERWCDGRCFCTRQFE